MCTRPFGMFVSCAEFQHDQRITKSWLNEWHREDYLLGLITNGPSRAQWQKVERLDLRKYFDCLLVSGDLPWEKPDQHIFLEACRLLAVEPRACIMVGDKLETDIRVSTHLQYEDFCEEVSLYRLTLDAQRF